jgi:hypothetical protein
VVSIISSRHSAARITQTRNLGDKKVRALKWLKDWLHRWRASIPAASRHARTAIEMFSLRNTGKILNTAPRKAIRAGVMLAIGG